MTPKKATKVDNVIETEYDIIEEDFLSASSETEAPAKVSAPSSGQADAPSESRIKGSKSWEEDQFNANPWSQPNLLKAEITDKRFTIRWVRDGSRSNVDGNLENGYEFVTYRELKNLNKERLRNGKALDSVVRVKDLVLMKLPKERNEAKKRWLKSLQVDPKQTQEQFRNQARQAGVEVLEEKEARDLPSAFSN